MAGKDCDLTPQLKTAFFAPDDNGVDVVFFQGTSVGRKDLKGKLLRFHSSFLAAKTSFA
jgi:hypothetical protein